MIAKSFIETGGKQVVRVTFTLPEDIWADTIHLVGDFNDWNHTSHPFRRDRAGRWILTVDLDLGRAYQFRYLVDGKDWMNDTQADAHVHNPYGSDNFIIVTDANFKPHCDEREG